MNTETVVHVFETAGLGKAPFQCIGVENKTYQACPGAPVQPGGSCAYCGTGIMEHCIIRSADGKTFAVGNSCVSKTGDRGLVNETKRQINTFRREAKRLKDFEKIKALKALLATEAVIVHLKSFPHPKGWNGKTLFDYVTWMFENAGFSGRLKMSSYIDPKSLTPEAL